MAYGAISEGPQERSKEAEKQKEVALAAAEITKGARPPLLFEGSRLGEGRFAWRNFLNDPGLSLTAGQARQTRAYKPAQNKPGSWTSLPEHAESNQSLSVSVFNRNIFVLFSPRTQWSLPLNAPSGQTKKSECRVHQDNITLTPVPPFPVPMKPEADMRFLRRLCNPEESRTAGSQVPFPRA